jgi:hypothetical protein
MTTLRQLAGIAALGLTSCSSLSNAWMAGRTASAAENRIMLIRDRPASFGRHRLDYQAALYPDLALFLRKFDSPDFLAEMTNDEQHYLILYYLASRQAYACRTKGLHSHEVEFAGPYPITASEFKMLDGFRRQAARINRKN